MKNQLFIIVLSTSCFAAVNVPLTVKEALYPGSMSGVACIDEAVTVGVPIPDSAGITWPSGNIKWVKLRAIVPSVGSGGTPGSVQIVIIDILRTWT
jgi:hypothetical protein